MTRNTSGGEKEVTSVAKGQPDDYRFDVFLSYSRKDEGFGKKLEEELENYRLPKDVKGTVISKNHLNVFRDRKDLVPTDSDYYKTIDGYLKKSGYLVVVCSPNARRSVYVNQEITSFLQSHDAKRVIPVLLSGRPNNESGASPEEYAFPNALCDALTMPLAVDFTEYQRAPGRLNRGRYRDSWYTLLSKIFGTERAEIERLDAKRQARRRAIFAGVSVAIIAVLSVALVFAIISRREAVQERDRGSRLLYASDMNLSQRAFESGNVSLGIDLLNSHRPQQPGEEDPRSFEWYYLWRLYNSQLATFEATDDLAFSRDGASFATVTTDAVKIWDTASLRQTANLKLSTPKAEGSYNYASIDLSPDGRTLAYGDNERILLLEIGSGSSRELASPGNRRGRREMPSGEEPGESYGVFWNMVKGGTPRFSPDGKLLAVAHGCGLVAVYNAHSLEQLTRLGDGPPASGCASFVTFSPDGRLIAYGNRYNVSLWDTVTSTHLREPEVDVGLVESVGQVESVAFSPDGKTLAIGDRDRQVVLWKISPRQVLARLSGHKGWVTAVAFSHDGKTLYSGSDDQTVRLWDLSSYQGDRVTREKLPLVGTLIGHSRLIRSIKGSPAGRIAATIGTDRTVKLWDKGAGREFDSLEGVNVISADASVIAKTSGDDLHSQTTLFNLRGGVQGVAWTTGEIIDATVAPNGNTLVATYSSIREDGSEMAAVMKLWDVNSRHELASLPLRYLDRSPVFSRDGRLFTGIGLGGRSLIFWDTIAAKEIPPIRNDTEFGSFLLSADGKVIVTLDKEGGKVKWWNVASQKQLGEFERKAKREVGSEEEIENLILALSSDGQLLAFSDSKEVKLWNTNSSQTPIVLEGREVRELISAMAFSEDGKLLAVGDKAGMVSVWDVGRRERLSTFIGHKAAVTALAFSPDGRTLASGGENRDAAVKLYGLASMRELLTLVHEPSPPSETHALQGNEDTVMRLFFSANSRSLITLSNNQVLRIWRGATDAGVGPK